jgi:hypothetical protein
MIDPFPDEDALCSGDSGGIPVPSDPGVESGGTSGARLTSLEEDYAAEYLSSPPPSGPIYPEPDYGEDGGAAAGPPGRSGPEATAPDRPHA